MKISLLIMFFILLSTTACTRNGHSPISISEADNGQTIRIQQNDTLVLTLEGNPTTGFSWELDTIDSLILRQVAESTFTPESDALGAAGHFVWRFEAANTGQTTLRLVYRRSWETNVAPESIFEVTVIVS